MNGIELNYFYINDKIWLKDENSVAAQMLKADYFLS